MDMFVWFLVIGVVGVVIWVATSKKSSVVESMDDIGVAPELTPAPEPVVEAPVKENKPVKKKRQFKPKAPAADTAKPKKAKKKKAE